MLLSSMSSNHIASRMHQFYALSFIFMADFLSQGDLKSKFLWGNALSLPKEEQSHLVFDYYLAFFLPVLLAKMWLLPFHFGLKSLAYNQLSTRGWQSIIFLYYINTGFYESCWRLCSRSSRQEVSSSNIPPRRCSHYSSHR